MTQNEIALAGLLTPLPLGALLGGALASQFKKAASAAVAASAGSAVIWAAIGTAVQGVDPFTIIGMPMVGGIAFFPALLAAKWSRAAAERNADKSDKGESTS